MPSVALLINIIIIVVVVVVVVCHGNVCTYLSSIHCPESDRGWLLLLKPLLLGTIDIFGVRIGYEEYNRHSQRSWPQLALTVAVIRITALSDTDDGHLRVAANK